MLSSDAVERACDDLSEARLVLLRRDRSTPTFNDIHIAMDILIKLDIPIKLMLRKVLVNPDLMSKAPHPVVRFVRESIDFVANGQPRSINIEGWDKVIDLVENGRKTQASMVRGPSGVKFISPGSSNIDTLFKPHVSLHADTSISNCSLLYKWIQRDQGLSDALYSYELLGRIYAKYSC